MKLAEFHYDLPAERIAQEPVEPRDHSRLLVIDRQSTLLKHRHFFELDDFLRSGDVLVINSTRVFPARLRGRKKTGGKIEILLLPPKVGEGWDEGKGRALTPTLSQPAAGREGKWRVLIRGTTKPADLVFPEGLEARMRERLAEGEWIVEFSSNHLREYLDRHGEMPLPPYIKRPAPRAKDLERYQTVYAEKEGAVAAPTAGFHFTPDLLEKVRAKGVSIQSIVLHVGWGTFRPVRSETIESHSMLPETYDVSQPTVDVLNKARKEKRRIIAVGTTSVRTLETVYNESGHFHAGRGDSSLFIYPGYRFKAIDALITNFHLPDSTPLLLACAFYGGSAAEPFSLKRAYAEAIREGYRFYSYGDAMFIQ